MNPEQPNTNQQFPPQSTSPAPAGGQDQGQFASAPQPSPQQPPQGKKTGLMIAIAVIVLIVIGAVAFALMGSDKKADDKATNNSANNSATNGSENSAAIPANMQKYDVTDKVSGLTFSVSFYKNAKVEEKNSRTYLNEGEMGSMHSVFLGVATGDKIDCGKAGSTTMKLGGESTTVCYDSDNTQYAGYAKAKSGMVKINLAGQKAISLDDAKAIMESVSFK